MLHTHSCCCCCCCCGVCAHCTRGGNKIIAAHVSKIFKRIKRARWLKGEGAREQGEVEGVPGQCWHWAVLKGCQLHCKSNSFPSRTHCPTDCINCYGMPVPTEKERQRERWKEKESTRMWQGQLATVFTLFTPFTWHLWEKKYLDLYRVEETHTRTATPSLFMPAYTLQVWQAKLMYRCVMTMNYD